MYSHVIVIDQGTHSTRAIIYNQEGLEVFKSQQSIELFYSEKFHVEQNAEKILESCKYVIRNCLEYVKENNLHDTAFALTTQRSTIVAWSKVSGKALSPALSWLDTRAQDDLNSLKLDEAEVKHRTGLPISAHYGASKLKWLLRNDSYVQEAKQNGDLLFGPLVSYLLFNLLEQWPSYVDYANAHRTLLWNLKTRQWDRSLLKSFDIEHSLLPKTVPNSFSYGNIIGTDYPLVLVNGDQNSAVYGYGELGQDTTIVNLGTGGFVLTAGYKVPILDSKLLASITYSSDENQEYAVEGTINGAGAALTWAEEEWGIKDIGNVSWHEVKEVPVFLNSVGGLGSPYWMSDLTPRFADENKTYKDYSTEQCKAALMESIAFLVARNIEELRSHGIEPNKLIVAGGLSTDEHLCQLISNICTAPVVSSSFKEATSRGAARLCMQRPDWKITDSHNFIHSENENIHTRYQIFKKEIEKLIH